MTLPSLIIGFDPGVKGAYALYWPEEPAAVLAHDFPQVCGELDLTTLYRHLSVAVSGDRHVLAIIESVSARPGNGVSSMFKFGASYGALRGIVAAMGIPTHLVSSGKWKRHYSLDSDKEKSRALALRLFPGVDCFTRKKDHGRAEAALLAKYGADVLSSNSARAAA